MSDEQVAPRLQVLMELIDERFLCRSIEVDHDVPAEDEIEGTFDGKTIVHQIEPPELNHRGQMWLDLEQTGTLASPS